MEKQRLKEAAEALTWLADQIEVKAEEQVKRGSSKLYDELVEIRLAAVLCNHWYNYYDSLVTVGEPK